MPYDQFVRWQVAGDEIAPEEPLALAATGFLGAGVFPTQLTEKEFESARYDELDDMVRTLGTAMLGVTIGCARCHDHKFDAIPQADYYRMVANFTTTIRSETEVPLTSVSYPERFQRPEGAPPEPEFATLMVSTEGLKPLKHHADGRGFPHFYPKTHYLRRGDVNHKEEVAEPAFLQVLTSAPEGGPHWHQSPPPAWRTSYRRRALANWITDTDYGAGALLARVIVNRLWQHHFGRGIVATPSDFGKQGQPPSHPELLEYLAARLVREDWQLKPIHRLIMESATYQQSSEHNARAAKLDPENNLLWRYEPRRLEAEVSRDILLAVSGELDRTMYGPGTLDEGQKRRSIYFMVKRSKLIPMLQTFDAPRADVGIAARPRTTVAPQSLLLMNNPHVRSYARSFAERVLSHSEGSVGEGVRHAYLLALCRPPTDKELSDGVAFVEQQRRSYAERKLPDAVELAMQDYCQVLFCLNEFLYVD